MGRAAGGAGAGAQFESLEEILAEAAMANARLMGARAIVERLARGQGRTKAQAALYCARRYRAAEVIEIEEALAESLVFGKTRAVHYDISLCTAVLFYNNSNCTGLNSSGAMIANCSMTRSRHSAARPRQRASSSLSKSSAVR